MITVVQRVTKAKVSVDGKQIAKIGKGFLVLLGVGSHDLKKQATQLAQKISKLRIMADKDQKMNLSIKDAKGEILVISQFTLLGNTKKGNRPSFVKAAMPQKAEPLYKHFVDILRDEDIDVKTGKFGAFMQVNLTNDGPTTIILESK